VASIDANGSGDFAFGRGTGGRARKERASGERPGGDRHAQSAVARGGWRRRCAAGAFSQAVSICPPSRP
jgi:hypothetical protein